LDNLIRHVREQFYCADPVSYKKVWRSIRTSKSSKIDRAYAIGMYTNSSGVKICQACKQPSDNIQVDQIANYGIEMPQLNLCMCNNCAAKYKAVRDGNKDIFGDKMRNAILSLDISAYENEYVIQINADLSLHFTQTHVAELQEIFRLLDEYGVPSENVDLDEESRVFSSLLQEAREETQENNTEQPVITETQLDSSSVQEHEVVNNETVNELIELYTEDALVVVMSGDHCPKCGKSNTNNEKIRVIDTVGNKKIIYCRKCPCGKIYLTKRLRKLLPSTVKYIEVGEKSKAEKNAKVKPNKRIINIPKTKKTKQYSPVAEHKSGLIYVVNKGKISSVNKDDSQLKCPYCGNIGLFGGKGMCWDCYKDMMSSRYD
jgi:hypothetical protein